MAHEDICETCHKQFTGPVECEHCTQLLDPARIVPRHMTTSGEAATLDSLINALALMGLTITPIA